MWIDTHCHWDAAEFGEAEQAAASRLAAREQGVTCCVVPAVETANFEAVRAWAHQHDDVYALGIHPLFAQSSTMSSKLLVWFFPARTPKTKRPRTGFALFLPPSRAFSNSLS